VATVLDAVITPALKSAGILSIGETPTAEDANDALVALNQLIDQWAAERLMVYTTTRSTWTITASDGSYTVGTGGDISIARPMFIEGVGIIETSTDPDQETPLDRLTEDAYAGIVEKARTSVNPTAYYYNPTFSSGLGTLSLFPVPTSSTLQGVIYHPTAVTSFSALSTTVSLPPGYERMLRTNLAVELIPMFKLQPDQLLLKQAVESKEVVKRSNKRTADLMFESAALMGKTGGYNIYTDR
jgi:hypothetical protein